MRFVILSMLLGTVFLATFQNCGKGFKPIEIATISSQGLSLHISHNHGNQVNPGTTLTFFVDGVGLEGAQLDWSHTFSSGTCEDDGIGSGSSYEVTCNQNGLLSVRLSLLKGGETAIAETRITVGDGTPPPPPPDGNEITFRISNGTGNTSYNTRATAVVTFVGQTLRVINDDTVNHRIHTNGTPFAHGNDILPGQAASYVIASAHNPDTAGPLYDHNFQSANPRPDFWVYAYDGAALYQTNCMSCHGALATSTKRNKSFSQIRTALQNQSQMQNIILTDDQVRAIVYSLSR